MSWDILAVPRGRIHVKLDVLALALLAISMLSFMWLGTWVDVNSELSVKAMYAALLLVSGLALGSLFTHVDIDTTISGLELMKTMMWTALALAGIILAGSALRLSSVAWEFAVLIAGAEEAFFRFFLTSMLASWMGKVMGSIASGLVFALYHMAVYGASATLLVIWVSGVILAYTFLESGSLTPTLLAHMVVNYLAAA